MRIYHFGDSRNVIGKLVKELRLEKHLSQKALAEKRQLMGYEVSDLTILRIENGTRFVPDYEVVGLCKALEVSPAYLLGMDSER